MKKTFIQVKIALLCFLAYGFFSPLFGSSQSTSTQLDKFEDLLYADPHRAVAVYQKIFEETSPEKDLKLWLRAAMKLNSSYFHVGDLTQVPLILQKTLEKASQTDDGETYSQLLIQQHSFLYGKGDFNGAQAALDLADRVVQSLQNPTAVAQVLMYRARNATRQGHNDEGLDLLKKAIVTLKNAEHNTRYYAMLHNMSFMLYEVNGQKIDESLKIYEEITPYFDRLGLHYLGAIAYENYASFLVKGNRMDEALAAYGKAIQHATAIKDEFGIAISTQGLGLIFQQQNRHRQALEQFQKARPTFAKFDSQASLANIDLSLARSHLALGQADEALTLVTTWKSYYEEKTSPDTLAIFLRLEADILEQLEQAPEAMRAYKRLSLLQQDIFDSKKQELTNRYYAEFEVERRNQENLKLEHQNRLQSITIDNQHKLTQRTGLALGGAVIALAILAFSFYRAQLSRRKIESLQRYIETNVLQRFLPPELVQEILAGKSRLDDRTKTETVTVLFADLCQFTRATDKLGPETISHILNDFFVNMTEVIFTERGTIDKFIGDAIMVIFGAPSPLPAEDQAHAAVRCARKMQDKLRELNKAWELSEGQHFEMRIGIHQGQAVVGTFGGSKRSDYTVVGTSVNIAARVENIADPNTILVTDAITRFIDPRDFALRGHYRLRGLETEIPLFRVEQSSTLDKEIEQAS